MIGYGRTVASSSSPSSSSSSPSSADSNDGGDLEKYSLKTAADDLASLIHQLVYPEGKAAAREEEEERRGIIVGGHDWGGMIAHRFALWYPELVRGLFTVCTPYTPPSKEYIPLQEVVKRVPNFGYQIQLAGGEVEEKVKTKEQIKGLLNGLFGGRTKDGNVGGFDVRAGIDFTCLKDLTRTRLMSEEMLDYYAEEYSRQGVGPSLNWYRTREINHRDELKLLEMDPARVKIECPVLFISAKKDDALPPRMSRGMEKWVPRLTRREVDASHWALWEKPDEVNGWIGKWLDEAIVPGFKAGETSEERGRRTSKL